MQSDREAILSAYDSVRADQLALCDALEAVADSLPSRIDRQTCLQLARAIKPLMARAHEIEEQQVFPEIRRQAYLQVSGDTVLTAFMQDHAADLYYTDEVSEALMALGSGNASPSLEATGYLLRGFFDGLRRHIVHEGQLVALLRAESGPSSRTCV